MQHTTATALAALRRVVARLGDETAEGVISTAIAVLILAFVGAGMWLGFNAMMSSSCDAAAQQLDSSIGGSGSGSSTISCD